MKLKPNVVKVFQNLKKHRTNGETLQGIFDDLCRMENTYKAIIEDLRRKVYNPSQFEASLKSKIKEVFHDPIKWARIGCHGISQQDVDFIRSFFPHIIPGHDPINNAKVYHPHFQGGKKREGNFLTFLFFFFKKTLLTEIKKVLPVVKFASGHGFDFLTVANQALEHELEAPDHFPGAILAVLSLDAKFVFKQHYTQTSLR